MKQNFETAYAFTTSDAIEGGFSDDPNDPGGATMHGISLAEYQAFKHNPDLTIDDLKQISPEDEEAIYRGYWDAVHGDDLPAGVDLSVFDMGVNAGPGTSVRQLQQVLQVSIDGIIGKVTLGAAERADAVSVCVGLWTSQVNYYQSLSTYQYFGRGWMTRAKLRLSAALLLCP